MVHPRWGHEVVLSIVEAARRGGWPAAMWHSWEKFPGEKGYALPSSENMVRLCDMTGLTPNDFYFKNGVPYRIARNLEAKSRAA